MKPQLEKSCFLVENVIFIAETPKGFLSLTGFHNEIYPTIKPKNWQEPGAE